MTDRLAPALCNDGETPAPRAAIPAWGMSLGLHVVLLLIIALVMPRSAPSQGVVEGARPGAIVLVETARDGAARYFSDEPDTTKELTSLEAAAPAASEQPAEGGGASAAETLPPGLGALLPSAPAVANAGNAVEVGKPLSQFRGAGRSIAGSQAAADAEARLIAAERGALAGSQPTGPTAKVSLFGSAEAEGRTFAFVIDRSASMGGEGLGVLDAAAEQLAQAIAVLEPTHRFQIIAYNQRPKLLGPKAMSPATDENKRLAEQFARAMTGYGSTNHELALVNALAARPDVLFLLTDGGDPFLTPSEFRRVKDMARGRTTIHCIQFGQGPPVDAGEAFMRRLAEESGGSYVYVDVDR